MALIALFGAMLVIMLLRVALPLGVKLEGEPLGKITLSMGERVRLQRTTKSRQHGDSNRHEREHARPRLEATDACICKTQQAFRIAKAFLTGKAPRVLLRHPVSRQVTVRQQVPDAPSAVLVTRTCLDD